MVDALIPEQVEGGDDDLQVHQALHGYADGHRLLESSIAIPDDLKRLLLRMSDLSGTTVATGFQEYLTGYPLPSLSAYALAKTWYASEMPRPGCVWTHTLIIPASVLSSITDLSVFRALFRRPGELSSRDAYSKPIRLEARQPALNCEHKLDQVGVMHLLLAAHYVKAHQPLILSASDSDQFTSLIFAIWSQKWPALRMEFSFCTGTLSARTIGKRPLDVQCVPVSMTRQVAREIASESSGEPIVVQQPLADESPWVALAADDALRCDGEGLLRKFLWAIAETDSGRLEFAPFVSIYDSLRRSVPSLTVLHETAELFPLSTDGRRLKHFLFGDRQELGLPPADIPELIRAAATTEQYASFETDGPSIANRASRYIAEEPMGGCKLLEELLRASLNPLGEEILSKLMLAMTAEDALAISRTQPQFLPTLFRGNPALASSAELWSIAGDHRRELFESLLARNLTDSEVEQGIVRALFESGSEAFLGLAFARWGATAIFQALDWIDAHDGGMNEACRSALTGHLSDVMAWVHNGRRKSASTLAALAHVVAPYASQVVEGNSTVWLETLRTMRQARRYNDAEYMSAFILALALCNAQPAPLDLVAESFESIHLIAERNQMRDSVWFILQPLVPELSWRKNWDKCERMRRALVSAFVRYSWPAWELGQRIKDEQLVRQLLKSASNIDAEYYFKHV